MLSCVILSIILILKLIFYAFLTLILLLVAAVVGLKVWLEPVKGVCTCRSRLDGKVALVTGGNSGIGLETARGLARRGARVVIASRDVGRSRAAVADIARTTGNALTEYRYLDLAKFSSVRQFAEDFNRAEPRLDILVNNAGCGGAKARLTEDGIDLVTQINYFGAFLLTNLLLDKLASSKPSRIVIVSSVGHRFCRFDVDDIAGVHSHKLTLWEIYARSKLLQVFWTKALAKRLPAGVTVNAVHPGVVRSDIFKRVRPAWVRAALLAVIAALFKSCAEGAQTALHASAAPELADASGGYYADCRPSSPRGIVYDDRLVERVWHQSLALTQTKPPEA